MFAWRTTIRNVELSQRSLPLSAVLTYRCDYQEQPYNWIILAEKGDMERGHASALRGSQRLEVSLDQARRLEQRGQQLGPHRIGTKAAGVSRHVERGGCRACGPPDRHRDRAQAFLKLLVDDRVALRGHVADDLPQPVGVDDRLPGEGFEGRLG